MNVVDKYFKYVSRLNEKGSIKEARENSAYLILTIDEQLLFNFFIEDGVYMVRDRGEYHLVAAVNQREYDTSRVFLFSQDIELLCNIYLKILENPKIGLYKKEQKLLNQIRRMSYRPYEPSEETLLRYIFFNLNEKVYLLRWRLNNDERLTKKQRVLGEKNLQRLLNQARDELDKLWKEEKNVEALQDNSSLEDYDVYNYTSNDIVVNLDEEVDNYYYNWE